MSTETKLKIIAWSFIAYGAAGTALVLLNRPSIPDRSVFAIAPELLSIFLRNPFIHVLLLSQYIIAGVFLLARQAWARYYAILLGLVLLTIFPVGTAIGTLALLLLFDKTARKLFNPQETEEVEREPEQPRETPKWMLVVGIILLLGQVALTLYMAYVLQQDLGLGAFVVAIFIYVTYPVAGIAGFLYAAMLRRRKAARTLTHTLLLTSISMASVIPGMMWTGAVSNFVMEPIMSAQEERAWGEHLAEELRHYEELKKEFEQPQIIQEINTNYILLESGYVLRLHEEGCLIINPHTAWKQGIAQKKVNVVLPDFAEFSQLYDKLHQWDTQFLKERRGDYGIIPSLVYLDGELIATSYSAQFGALEKCPDIL